jgi:NAD(P)-dependent dehydrogenase (short-subunit alcohol dehydrogenase family)
MSKYLADKVIVVAGAGSGFGKRIAEKCAAGGAKADDLVDAVVHVIDQPWGISLSDVTVRTSGENYVY